MASMHRSRLYFFSISWHNGIETIRLISTNKYTKLDFYAQVWDFNGENRKFTCDLNNLNKRRKLFV